MKSTLETVQQARAMVGECIALIRSLCGAGKSVVCIFDFDAVMGATSSSGLDAVKVEVPGFGELLVVPDRREGLKRIQQSNMESLLAAAAILRR